MISLQIQVERQPNIHYPEIYPEVYHAGIKMNDDDELFIFLKTNVESILSKIILPSNIKFHSLVAEGSGIAWENCFEPGSKIYDIEKVRDAFLIALQKSYNRTKGRKNYYGSLAHLLLDRFGCTADSFKDMRVVYTSLSSAFDIHDDCDHTHSSKESITVNINLFCTLDYVSGIQGSGPWSLYDSKVSEKLIAKDVVMLNKEPYIKRYLGERYVYFSKSDGQFLKSKERADVDQRGDHIWPSLPSLTLCRNILKYQNVKIPQGTDAHTLFEVHNTVHGVKGESRTKRHKKEKIKKHDQAK